MEAEKSPGGIERKTRFVVSCVQASPVAFDLTKSLDKVACLTAKAASAGAELVLFPEAFLTAYPRGTTFGTIIGSRSPEGRDEFKRYFDASVDVPGPATEALSKIAAGNGVHLVIGVIEREAGTLYCTVLFFGPGGGYLGKHRKLMPTAAERLVWGYGDGSTLSVIETAIGKLGAVICWENYMPMLRTAMYGQGIELYCAPTADPRPTWVASMQHIALEGRCFVLSTNQFCRRRDLPDDFPSTLPEDPEAIICRGGACIVDPLGQILAGPLWDEEGILTAEIDLADITRAKLDFDPVGHYSRPDVFQLAVDLRPKPAVSFER